MRGSSGGVGDHQITTWRTDRVTDSRDNGRGELLLLISVLRVDSEEELQSTPQ